MDQEAVQPFFPCNQIQRAACDAACTSYYSSPPPSPRLRHRKTIIQTSLLLQLPAEIRALILVAAFGRRTVHADLDIISTPAAGQEQTAPRRPSTPPGGADGGVTRRQDLIDLSNSEIQWQSKGHLCHRRCFDARRSRASLPAPLFVVDRDRCFMSGGTGFCNLAAPGLSSCRIGALGWLLTCRQAYAEGVEVLYRYNTFRLNESFALENMDRIMSPACSSQITQLSLSLTMGRPRVASDRIAYPRPRDAVEHLPGLFELLPATFPNLMRLHLVLAGEMWPEAQLAFYCSPSEALHARVESMLARLEGIMRRLGALRLCEVAFDSSVYFPWLQIEKGLEIDFKDYTDFEQCPYTVWRQLAVNAYDDEAHPTTRRQLSGFWVCLDAWDAIPWSVMTDLYGTGPCGLSTPPNLLPSSPKLAAFPPPGASALFPATLKKMPSENTPLLVDEQQRADAGQDAAAVRAKDRRHKIREAAIFSWALIATAAFIVIAVWVQHREQTLQPKPPAAKRNLVFMVSDGMGPASLALTRGYRQHVEQLDQSHVLVLDRHFWGSSRTRSSNSLVTDSAAGATAFSCAHKSYNGAISVLPDGRPCGSVLEAAKRAGYMTGLVATTYVTDATPACFAAHVPRREMMDQIALQEIGAGTLGRSVDLIMGGGRCYFLPNSTDGGCRKDDVDVTKIAREQYRCNHNDTYPSLREMATTALRALERATRDSDKGFFIMIEGSRIDHAGHINDPAAQVHEVLAYDATFQAVLDFIASTDTETVLVATSDHETGGLATALQKPTDREPVYLWHPEVLDRATASCEHLAGKLRAHVAAGGGGGGKAALRKYIKDELVVKGLGVKSDDVSDAELDSLVAAADDAERAKTIFTEIISHRARIGWSTHGHSAVDVNIYSSGGPGTKAIRGNVENTEVGDFLRRYLDVDVDSITKELQAASKRSDEIAGVMKARGAFDEYHGSFQH
ncbi:hypothetical protein PWT90_03889 [Aphanocladium album]|nr:hypothetical protein PWT90_03889 [Aphanocladium album]